MDELDTELEELGRSIAPDLGAARGMVAARAAGTDPGAAAPHRGWRGSMLMGAAVAVVMAGALGTTVALRHSSTGGGQAGVAGQPGAGDAAASAAANTAQGVTATTSTSGVVTGTLQTLTPAPLQSPATATPLAPSGSVVRITEATGGPVTVHRGQLVKVDLGASFEAWSEPQSSNPAVLVWLSGSTGKDGSAHALFQAVADGTVAIFAAQAPPACFPRCLPPQRAIDITIVVTG